MEHSNLQEHLKLEPEEFDIKDVPDITDTEQQSILNEAVPTFLDASNIHMKQECMPIETIKKEENNEECSKSLPKPGEAYIKKEGSDDRRSSTKLQNPKTTEKVIQTQIHQNHRPDKVMVVGYECRWCKYQTRNKEDFTLHTNGHKDTSIVYHCSQCSYQTKRRTRFTQHSLGHKTVVVRGVYDCTVCPYQTRYKFRLSSHIRQHKRFSQVARPQVVDAAGESSHHTTDSALFDCTECDFQATSKMGSFWHSTLHSSSKIKSNKLAIYKCDICNFQTAKKNNMSQHKLRHKDSKDDGFRCFDCDFTTKFKCALNMHIQSNKRPSRDVLKCLECDFQAGVKCVLRKHELTHKSDELVAATELHLCLDCNFQTTIMTELRRHMTDRHRGRCHQTS